VPAPVATGVAAPQQLTIDAVSNVPVDIAAIPLQVRDAPPPSLREAAPPATPARLPQAAPAPVAEAPPPKPREPVRESLIERAADALSPVPPVAAPVRPRNLPDLPPITLALPSDSGLELVQTTARIAAPPDEPAPAPRPKRVRPPRAVVAEEPLQIVETRHKDGDPPAA